jgi:hypothetical protein
VPGAAARRAERTPPLIAVSAAGQFLLGALVEDHQLVGRLVHAHGHHRQALRVFLLTLTGHAVVVFPGSFGMQFGPAGDALRHRHSFATQIIPQ